MGTLYIALDLFCAEPFRFAGGGPEAQEYASSPENVWAVVQPAITINGPDAIPLKDYFSLTAASFKAQGHKIVFIGDDPDANPPRPTAVPTGTVVPVPLLPGTELELLFSGVSIAKRTLKLQRFAGDPDDPLLLPVSEWPQFAMSAFSPPSIQLYEHLAALEGKSGDFHKQEILAWAVSLVPTILQRVGELPSGSLTAAEKFAYDLLKELEREIARREDAGESPPDQEYVIAYLKEAQGAQPRVAALWDEMLKPASSAGPRPIYAPRFRHDEKSLTSNPRSYLGLADPFGPAAPLPESVSLLGKLWWDLRQRLQTSTGDEEAQALGRLFAFGERRRWPEMRLHSDPTAFMILDEVTPPKAKQLKWAAKATNAFSLLGLAFKLPIQAGDVPPSASLALTVMGNASPDYREPLDNLVTALKNHSGGFGAKVCLDADRPAGFFYFVPKMAEGVSAKGPGGSVFVAPPALLDIVEPEARWTAVPKASAPRPRLSHVSPQRTAFAPSELYRPELTGASGQRLSLKVRVAGEPLSTAIAFRISLEAAAHPSEAAEIESRFARAQQGLEQGVELWGADSTGAINTWGGDGQIRRVGKDVVGRPYLIVEDDGTLQAFLDALANPGEPTIADTEASAKVYLVFPPVPSGNPKLAGLFNVATAAFPANEPPLFILNRNFTSRVNVSADRLSDRIEVLLKPGKPQPQSVLEEHLWNFNKLRLRLTSNAAPIVTLHEDPWRATAAQPVDTVIRPLLDPDAALPMSCDGYTPTLAPWLAASPTNVQRTFGYFVTAVFTQDHKADEALTTIERNQAEALRYTNYLTPEIPWALEGHVEHQYSFRIGLEPATVMLRLASDISHPGEAAVREDKVSLDAVPLVHWDFDSAHSAIQLRFPRAYLALALKGDDKRVKRPARLRAIYEPLAELISGINSSGEARLKLERWVFDADGHLDPGEIRTSAVPENMRLAGWHELTLAAGTRGLQDLKTVRDLLALPLTELETALEAESKKLGEDWLVLKLAFDGSWSAGGDPLQGPLGDVSDVLRLGLELVRSDASVVDPAIVSDPSTAQGFGLPIDDDLIGRYPALKGETFGMLTRAAAEELKDYLAKLEPSKQARSRLRKSFAWLQARGGASVSASVLVPMGKSIGPNTITDPQRPERIFGPLSPFLLVTAGKRPPVVDVLDLYFVPFAFRPLAIHPEIGDAATTLEFAMFLTELLDDLVNGRDPVGLKIAQSSVADALRITQALVDEVAKDSAQRMVELLTWVHNDQVANPSTLFGHVHNMAERVFRPAGAKRVLADLFAASPNLYASSKGFGLVLFDETTWTDRLHSVQLVKQIRPPDPATERKLIDPRIDRDTFVFSAFSEMDGIRYVVDILDDNRYDNEFQIAQSSFSSPRAWPLPAKRQLLKTRGGAQARSGEDVIEGRHSFDDVAPLRQIEADAVSWNPDWKYPGIADLYLLPSRRIPSTPFKIKAVACGRGSGEPRTAHPWRSDIEVSFLSGRSPNIPDQFKERMTELLRKKAEVVLSMASTTSDSDLVATRRTDATVIADGAKVRDWWCLDAFASEHYFVFESDEEGSGGDIPFSNDRFRIDIEVYENPPPDEAEMPPPAQTVPGVIGTWFDYRRKLRNGQDAAPPARPTLTEVDRDLRHWLGLSAGTNILTPRPPALLRYASARLRVTQTYFVPGRKVLESVDHESGSVLAAEIMDLKTGKGTRYVLRVVVLDDCWTVSRVRIRLERNLTDASGDGVPDINPAFQMFSAFSAWSSHGRERYVRDFTAVQSGSLPSEIMIMEPRSVDAQSFIDGVTNAPSQPLDYGDLLKSILDATFKGTDKVTRAFWHETRAQSQSVGLGGLIVQRRRDLHPRFDSAAITSAEPSREEDIPRMHLPSLLADRSGELFASIIPSYVRSLHHDALVVWTSSGGDPLLECRWPIRFRA